jgi:hypothetical protein
MMSSARLSAAASLRRSAVVPTGNLPSTVATPSRSSSPPPLPPLRPLPPRAFPSFFLLYLLVMTRFFFRPLLGLLLFLVLSALLKLRLPPRPPRLSLLLPPQRPLLSLPLPPRLIPPSLLRRRPPRPPPPPLRPLLPSLLSPRGSTLVLTGLVRLTLLLLRPLRR